MSYEELMNEPYAVFTTNLAIMYAKADIMENKKKRSERKMRSGNN